jgi:hypothetical protein
MSEQPERTLSEKLKTVELAAKILKTDTVREAKKKEADAGNPYPHSLRD